MSRRGGGAGSRRRDGRGASGREAGSGGDEGAQPTDARIDRRAFVSRMALLGAAGAALAGAPGGAGALAPARARGAWRSPPPHPLAFARDVRPEARADPAELTVAEALTLLRDGVLVPEEILEACLARIARLDGVYAAFNTVTAESARAEARAAAAALGRSRASAGDRPDAEARAAAAGGGLPGGLLGGIPVAVKDNIYSAGVATTANSLVFRDFVPDFDATLLARLRGAGAVMIGKTQMGPLATTRATTPEGSVTTVNAWAPRTPSVSPGGSSSGTATAVAARLAPCGIGTQTGGSITVPALAQGLTGLKPTMGRVSLHGVIPLTYTRDHPGPLARDAKDAAIVLAAMAGADPADPRTLGLPAPADYVEAAAPVRRGGRVALRWPTTIGVFPDYASESGAGTPARAAARRRMIGTFETLGARVVEVEPPDEWELLTGPFNAVRLPERSEPFLEHLRRDVRLFGVSLSPWINGLLLGGDEYLKGQRAKLLLLRRILDDLLSGCDAVLQPSHLAFDITGLPLIAFPIGTEEGPEGAELPVGAMLGGLPFAEDRLLSLVAAYQAVTEWHLRRPADPEIPAGDGRPGSRGGSPGDGRGRGPGGGEMGGRGRIDALDVMELSQ